MRTSAAATVKEYIEKYISINILKTKQHKYLDQPRARKTLSIACNISHQLDELIKSNNANDFPQIKECLRKEIASLRKELQRNQRLIAWLFVRVKLPCDFDKCIHTAWVRLHYYETWYLKKFPPRRTSFLDKK